VKRVQARLQDHQERYKYIQQRQSELRMAEAEVQGLINLLDKTVNPEKIVINKAGCQVEYRAEGREEVLSILSGEVDLIRDQVEAMDEQVKQQKDAARECQVEVQEILEAHVAAKEEPVEA